VVQFSHFSVKEFLTLDRLARSSEDVSRFHIVLVSAHTILAQACLGVLLRLDDTVNGDNAKNIPLAKYAARHWVDHARYQGVSSSIRDTMEYFFDAAKPHRAAWPRVYDKDKYWLWFSPDRVEHVASPLYYASLCGFYDLAEHLVNKYPEDINARGGWMVVPLVAALHEKHFRVAELLRRHGADVNVRGHMEYEPLHISSMYGRADIVHWLLDHGAEPNTRGLDGWNPLHYATFHGYLKATRALLEHGADINVLNNDGEIPLHLASGDGHDHLLDILQLLISYGSDVNARNKRGSTFLHYPVHQRGRGMIVDGMRLLLKHGANVDARDNEGKTPLQVALERGHHEMAEFLSEQGATR